MSQSTCSNISSKHLSILLPAYCIYGPVEPLKMSLRVRLGLQLEMFAADGIVMCSECDHLLLWVCEVVTSVDI